MFGMNWTKNIFMGVGLNQSNPFNGMNINLNNNMNNPNQMGNIGGFPQNNNINNFGNNNNKRSFFKFKNIVSPIKSIFNLSSNQMNFSYANATLQSLACLKCIRQWYLKLYQNKFTQFNNNPNSITRQFFNILFLLFSGKEPDSSTIIQKYFQKVWELNKKQPKADPFHFLFYFLEIFHLENNETLNTNFNINEYINPNINNLMNDQYMLTLYQNYFKLTQHSIVSSNFFNTYRYEIRCQNQLMKCPSLYRYKIIKIIQFDVEKSKGYRDKMCPSKIGYNINLEDCFLCLQDGEKVKCIFCGSYNAFSISHLWYSNKVLIFSFNRIFHTFNSDIDFGTQIDMSKYCKFNMHGYSHYIYNLKACISLYQYNKYFVDIEINGNWFRFMDRQYRTLDNSKNEIFLYEPQLLIYEINEAQNNNIMINRFFN